MSLARGKFGIEYDPRQMQRDPSGLGWVFAVVAIAAFASLTWTLVKRVRERVREDAYLAELAEPHEAAPDGGALPPPETNVVATPPAKPVVDGDVLQKRPPKVRNLLMRLEEAERRHDVEMAVTTIETIRALPGSPAADLDDSLARRLGALNLQRLFNLRCAQWVREVTVKRGDSASRIASEHGSTLASLAKLNGGDVDRIFVGKVLYVMNHPRFNLVVHRRTRIADLALNGKFFRRYDLLGEVGAKEGAYELPERKRTFWNGAGIRLKEDDRAELEMLLPSGTSVLVSEL